MRLLGLASLLLILSSSVALFAADSTAAGRPYLALGDSVSFGFITNAGFEYVNPENFIGFPDYVGQTLKLHTSNAACPGETSGSFLSSTAPDDGCHLYRSQVPLHVSYISTQLDFAVSFLKSYPETKLVSIGLGANDVLLLRTQCANDPACIALELPQVLAAVETNVATILSDLRAAGFKGDHRRRELLFCGLFGYQWDCDYHSSKPDPRGCFGAGAHRCCRRFHCLSSGRWTRWWAHMQCGTAECITAEPVHVRHSSQPGGPEADRANS